MESKKKNNKNDTFPKNNNSVKSVNEKEVTFYKEGNSKNNKMKYDPKTTKPSKPDFSQQFKEFEENKKKKNIPPGLKRENDSNDKNPIPKNTLSELSEKNNFQVQYKGLNNYGNMCYSNVIMQSMVSIKEFVNMLNAIVDKVENSEEFFLKDGKNFTDLSFRYPALFNLVKIMNFYEIKNTSLASKHIKILTNYFDIRGEQNDAHEFLTFLFEKLNTEILDISQILIERSQKNHVITKENQDEKIDELRENIGKINIREEELEKIKDEKNKDTSKQSINETKITDLRSLLKSSNTKNIPKSKANGKSNVTKRSNQDLIDLNEMSTNLTKSNINDGWEEVKKGGNRMKLGNTEESFDISMIGKIFQGILKHDLETKGLSLSKCLIEPFFVLSLDLAEFSLDNCFDKFFSRKKVENITNPAASFFQRAYIEKLPKILIIHVKGFFYDKVALKVVKVNKELEYPFELKIRKDYFSPSVYNQYKDNEFELISVIIHKGIKASEGHYICFCKDSNDIWWALDDSKIFQVDENSFKHFRPYILFYRRIN